jgi:hypothetical protein
MPYLGHPKDTKVGWGKRRSRCTDPDEWIEHQFCCQLSFECYFAVRKMDIRIKDGKGEIVKTTIAVFEAMKMKRVQNINVRLRSSQNKLHEWNKSGRDLPHRIHKRRRTSPVDILDIFRPRRRVQYSH